MSKTVKNTAKQDRVKYTVPRKVQDVIPVQRVWNDGIFQIGGKFSKTFRFSDINYLVASREDKEAMFLDYSELLNSLDAGATTKITINNHRLNRVNFERSILMPKRGDARDVYRREYNQMLMDKASRVEWCACFVSWCAEQCGYIEAGIIPKFAGCPTGEQWFKDRGQWADRNYLPNPGDIIFLDWASDGIDGLADHVGIVERCEGGVVYTVEGNMTNSCKQRQYTVGYYEICGYGVPAY